MALVSSPVAAGKKILADAFNKLRQDLLGHTHGGGEGGTIDHADLGETGAMSGRTYDHSDIDDHIDAEDAHGMPNGTNIGGTGPNQLIMVAGCYDLGVSETSGNIYLSEDGTTGMTVLKLDSVLAISLTCLGPTGGTFQHNDIPEVTGAYDAVNGKFPFEIDHVSGGTLADKLYFIVVGKKA